MTKYQIAETETFQKKIKTKSFAFLYPKILDYVYPILSDNPYFGPNIKKLKGNYYKDVYRFRIGNHRLFYKIENNKIIVFILDIAQRKDAYR